MISGLLLRYRFAILLAVVGITLGFVFQLRQLKVEQGNDSMNSSHEEMSRHYDEFKDLFGNDELIVVALSGQDWRTADGATYLHTVTAGLETLSGVTEVLTLHSITPPSLPGAAKAGNSLERLFLSDDAQTTGIFVTIEERPEDDGFRRRLVTEVDAFLAKTVQGNLTYHLTGVPVQKIEVARLIERDQKLVIPLSTLILGLTLFLMFRNIWGVLMPLLLTGLSLSWTLGLYATLGFKLNPITSLLPPLIMVLSVTTGVHLFQGWVSVTASGGDRNEALKALYDELFTPCFFTALTTAAGFVSLSINPLPAVRLFGIFGAVGVSVTFIIGILFLPIIFCFLPHVSRDKTEKNDVLSRLLERVARLSISRSRTVLGLGLAVAAVSLALIPSIRSNTDLVGFLKQDERLYKDTRFVDRELGGSNSFEFMIRRHDGKPLDSSEDLQRIADFIQHVESLPVVHSGIAITTVVQPMLPGGTLQSNGMIPLSVILRQIPRDQIKRLITPDWDCARVRFRLKTIGTADAAPVLQTIEDYAAGDFSKDFSITPTGSFHQVVLGSNQLVASQVKSFGLALLTALIAIGILLRSWVYMLVAAIPNVIPILICGGIMSIFQIDLSTGTAMIASVTIGLAVDDTIYFLAGFKNRWNGTTVGALQETTRHTGRALVISSVVLAIGFWVGCFGSFKPTIYFSLLTGVTMVSALVCDLLVLPACLKLICPSHNPGSAVSNTNP